MLTRKRMRLLAVTMAAVALTALAVDWISRRLGDESTFTGIVLLLATSSLYLLSIRKRMVTYRVGPVAAWLQWHVYAGTFTSLVFLMHIRWPVRGPFELCLASCFIFVAVSGFALGVLSRLTPLRLSALRQEHALEQIPALQYAVAEQAHRVALGSTKLGEGATLSEYYQRRLLPYFQTQRSWLYRLLPTGGRRRQLLLELADLDRYLASSGLDCRHQLSTMVQSKDDLDYQLALQSRLRWLFKVHVALTWSLVILIAVHVALVLGFSGKLL
jgi:hypothetical protein